MRSWKENQPLNIKTVVARAANFKARITKFQVDLLFYFTSLLFRRIFMTS